MLAENAFCHETATQGLSRSFILQSFACRHGVAYRHIILLAVSLTLRGGYIIANLEVINLELQLVVFFQLQLPFFNQPINYNYN